MELGLTDRQVSSVTLDGALVLGTDGHDELRVESPFRLTVDDQVADIDPEDPGAGGAAVQRLRGRITAGAAAADGSLRLVVGEVQLAVRPDPDYEAWGLTRADGSRVVCMPGGELATWAAT